jgi:hypothetical protein
VIELKVTEYNYRVGLKASFINLTTYLNATIEHRDKFASKSDKLKYRKLAKSLEKSLTALENAINIIGE